MKKYPVLLSVPHGGSKIPDEVKDILSISIEGILRDIDPFTREIYSLEDCVEAFVETDIPRTIIDMNRGVNDLPPENPDGIIKSKTCLNEEIYIPGKEPDQSLISELIEKYYKPYHDYLKEASIKKNVKFALDCHSMLAEAPPIAKEPGKKRPLVCLGNYQNKACSEKDVKYLKECFLKVFGFEENEVLINSPFTGGYIVREYGMNSLPWVLVELNRDLYLPSDWYENTTTNIDMGKISDIKNKFRSVIEEFALKV